ncbi:spore coat U domain-containing protein [Variovorax sp. OV329]|uniref:Csu type fimbrial protein n=1 Tax=Variovorax sp. OV329 TaxID=1882825 RepID=UPI0008F2C9FA|nr:spore coat U domain-containing protein [Variovorax sp. OV329]SFN28535.1 Spore coat protein U (SCPU) domain-containing protein [Variovorax sp. OV329]
MKKLLIASAAAVLTAAAFAAPNPATATFDVKLTVVKACAVTAGAGSDISFGNQDANPTANLNATNSISVTCSKGTAYTIGLTPTNNDTTGAGLMSAQNVAPVTGNTDKVPYQLRKVSATGVEWGNTNTNGATVGNGVSGTGTGLAQSIPVYATVPSTNFTPDSYKDTVTVNVRY